jgi:hydrogenase-4 component F
MIPMLLALILIPFAAGILAFALRVDVARRTLLALAALSHLALVARAWAARPAPMAGGWLAIDAPGLLFLSIASILFLAAAAYGIGALAREGRTHPAPPSDPLDPLDPEEGHVFSNAPEAIFTGCLLFFLGTMTVVCLSQHLGLLWVAVEATTLASAPLIYFHRHRRSLEAAWKYLLICSIGIALALLGNFFLAVATMGPGGREASLLLPELLARAGSLQPVWLRAAFIFLLVGYGTKMGLAPLHTWLPDAHSESPSFVSALLSGALLNCAFLGILRTQQVCVAAGQAAFGQGLLVVLGLFSLAMAAIFILGQADTKRMLAYSSVEHMGILALGVGVGGAGVFGAFFHAVNHSLTKAMLFLVAGNLLASYQTKSTAETRGILRRLPLSGILWLAGFFSITGSPPFGTFLSEFTIFKAAFEQGRGGVGVAYLILLALVFVAMATIVLRMAQGPAPAAGNGPPRPREPWSSVVPPAILGCLVLALGCHVPASLDRLLHEAARLLGGQ